MRMNDIGAERAELSPEPTKSPNGKTEALLYVGYPDAMLQHRGFHAITLGFSVHTKHPRLHLLQVKV